jgi:hypothetical protein
MTVKIISVCALLLMVACSPHRQSDQDLQGEAQSAVDSRLDTQATFSEMASSANQQISCGHVSAADAPNRGKVDRDFVYLHGRLVMDDEPDYDQAAMECDVATSGGNAAAIENTSGS